jgi:hypothetical protein
VNRNIRAPFLLVSLASPILFVLLFVLRAFDDNRLTSWQWVFTDTGPLTVFSVVFIGVSLALLFLRVSTTVRFPALALALASFGVAGFFWKAPEVIVDSSRYFTQAKHLELYGIGYFFREWGRAIQCWTDLPLVPFLYGVIFRYCGEERLFVEIFSTFLFSMSVVLTYLTGKELWDEETGLLGGAMLLCMPYLYSQAPLMLVDVPTMFFLMLAVYTFMKGIEKGGAMAVVASASLFLAVFSKYSTWPMLSVLAVIGAVRLLQAPPEDRSRYLLRSLLIAGAALLAAGGILLARYDVFSAQMRLLTAFQAPGLRKWGESFVSTFFYQIHPFVTVAAVSSAVLAVRKRDARYLIISCLLILVVVFQVRRIRYTLPLFPMVALMASYGLRMIGDRDLRRFVVVCALIPSIAVAVFAYRPFLEKISMVNLVKAGELLNGLSGEMVEVYTLPRREAALNPVVAVPLLDLYTRKKIVYDYDPAFFPHSEEAATSPLRFTWEYANPAYYRKGEGASGGDIPVAVISETPGDALPGNLQERLRGYRLLAEFGAYEGVYEFRTTVAVFARVPVEAGKEGIK